MHQHVKYLQPFRPPNRGGSQERISLITNSFLMIFNLLYCHQRVCLSVCLSVCLTVCSLAYLKNHTSKFHVQFCYTCHLWPWFGPLLTALQ